MSEQTRFSLYTSPCVLLLLTGCNAADEMVAPNTDEELLGLVEQLDLPGELLIS